MTATTLDLPVWAADQLDSDQAPLQQLADEVAALWSAGTGLELQPAAVALEDGHARVVLAEPWRSGDLDEPPEEAGIARLDRPFGQRPRDLAPALEAPALELLGRPLTEVSARDQRDHGRVVVELSLAHA